VTFELLLLRLRGLLREKVRNGELTERGMARATGVSQPHLHNILKGIRVLPPELADELLALAGLDLFILMGMKQFELDAVSNIQPAGLTDRSSPEIDKFVSKSDDPMVSLPYFQLPPDSSMEPCFRSGDIVYYEQGVEQRTILSARSAYLVSHNDHIYVRYLRMGGQRLYLASQESLQNPVRWDYVSLTDRHILEIVRGRIVWICRKVEEAEARTSEETCGLDRRAS